jgi:hypothetical protein
MSKEKDMKKIIILLTIFVIGLSFISCSTYAGRIKSGNVVLKNGKSVAVEGNVFYEENGDIHIYGKETRLDYFFTNNDVKEIHFVK